MKHSVSSIGKGFVGEEQDAGWTEHTLTERGLQIREE